VFDPERDFDPDARSFAGRIAAIALVTAAVCVAAWPSVSGFAAGPDHNTGCVAIVNGWRSEPAAPSAADAAAARAAFPPAPSPAQLKDAAFMTHWRAQFRAAQANPTVIRENARLEWIYGSGACVPESRHRLVRSALLLGAVSLAFILAMAGLRARRAAYRRRIAALA